MTTWTKNERPRPTGYGLGEAVGPGADGALKAEGDEDTGPRRGRRDARPHRPLAAPRARGREVANGPTTPA